MIKYSIVIPTYKHLDDCLIPCCESIKRNTNLDNVEVLIVANGCGNDGTKEYVENLGEPFKLIWLEEPSGYTKSTNVGIRESKGEYIILLNNDTELLDYQYKNEWIDVLTKPFLTDSNVAVTAPMVVHCPYADIEFAIFFCVMVKKIFFTEIIGMLDEIFQPGIGEDTDFCARCLIEGYKIVQVPEKSDRYYDYKKMTGNYPIYHKGEGTFANWPDGDKLIQRNSAILTKRYNKKVAQQKVGRASNAVSIEKATQCDGYMSNLELEFLAMLSRDNKTLAECGSWHGRSTRALGDNTSGVVYAIDTWNGSALEKDTNHASAKLLEGDHALYEFYQNNFDLVQQGKVLPMRMSGKNAALFFKEKGIQFDAVFIDAGHEEHEVREDIQCWLPLVKDGGTLCGHDYYYDNLIWDGVKKAVDNLLGNITVAPETSIWVYKKEARKPVVIDAFLFNNETEILDIRFEELFSVVDRFVIVEAMTTHGGKPKELVFQNNLDRYQKYLHKVTYLVIPEFPPMDESASITDKAWTRERYQRNYIMEGLKDCRDDDVIIISDVDEIPDKEAIGGAQLVFRNTMESVATLEMDLYYYNEHTMAKDKWNEAKILLYSSLKKLSPCGARYYKDGSVIRNAGRHLSYFGGTDKIIQKIEDTAHQELNTSKFKDPNHIKKAIENGTDLFGRDYVKFEMV